MKLRLKIKTKTWNRESSGLFDYENRNFSTSTFTITEDSFIIRSKDKVFSLPPTSEMPQEDNCKILATFLRSAQHYSFVPELTRESCEYEKPWLTMRGLRESEYLLSEGDVLRLGKIKLKVKEIKTSRSNDRKKTEVHSKNLQNGGVGKLMLKNDAVPKIRLPEYDANLACRVCLTEEVDKEDPLVSPCFCTGTMGCIHIKCLQKWLESKITQTSNNLAKVYRCKALECELCKFHYPSKIRVCEKVIDLILMEKPEGNYIVFETKSDGHLNYSVLSFEDKESFKLGRGYDTDMRIPDISVSRNHALILEKPSGVYIKDLNSKFGTLARIKQQIVLDIHSKIKVQCGRTLLKVSVKRPFHIFNCFLGCSKGKESDEDVQRHSRDAENETVPNDL